MRLGTIALLPLVIWSGAVLVAAVVAPLFMFSGWWKLIAVGFPVWLAAGAVLPRDF